MRGWRGRGGPAERDEVVRGGGGGGGGEKDLHRDNEVVRGWRWREGPAQR